MALEELWYRNYASFYSHILQDLFLPVIRDTFVKPNVLFERLGEVHQEILGENLVYPVHGPRQAS